MKVVQYTMAAIGMGLTLGYVLISYAHGNFATKDVIGLIREDLRDIKMDVREIRIHINRKEK